MENNRARLGLLKSCRLTPLCLLAFAIVLSLPAWGREEKVLQKSATDAQVRAGDDYMEEQFDGKRTGL